MEQLLSLSLTNDPDTFEEFRLLICRASFYLGLSNIPLSLDSGGASWQEGLRSDASCLSLLFTRWGTMTLCPAAGGTRFNHFDKVMSVSLSTVKLLFFPLHFSFFFLEKIF